MAQVVMRVGGGGVVGGRGGGVVVDGDTGDNGGE